jgi:hypothetical protein
MATLLGDFHRPEKSVALQAPWEAKNKLGFALGVATILVNVLLIVHVLQSKVDQPMEYGLSHGVLLLIGGVMLMIGVYLAARNRHS